VYKIMGAPDVIGLTPNGEVVTYDGLGNQTIIGSVLQLGAAAAQIYAGGWGVAATNAKTGNIYQYNGGIELEAQWTQIGGPGSMFAVGDNALYGLSPDGSGVWEYVNSSIPWGPLGSPTGGPVARIYTGPGANLFATDAASGNIYTYDTSQGPEFGPWFQVGGPGAEFAVGSSNGMLYGLTPNRAAVWVWENAGTNWALIGGAAGHIYAGAWGLVASDPNTQDLFQYGSGTEASAQWNWIGGPGFMFAVGDNTVYGITPSQGALFAYDGSGQNWSPIGGATTMIACQHVVPSGD
jgi:Tectonin domain